MQLTTKHLLPAAAAGALALALTASASAAPGHGGGSGDARPLAGMRIVMSNDDSMQMAKPNGSDGKGLYEVRRALCAAGADVVVMAPWAGQSGAGSGGTNSGTLTVQQRTQVPAAYTNDCSGAPGKGAVFGVCKGSAPCGPTTPSATPADTVRLALNGGLAAKIGWTQRPDLVVSGSNYGPNVASVVNDSGTLGAAIAAIEEHVPAVALNSSYDPTVTTSFEVADRTYRDTGDYGAAFIADMRKKKLLQGDFVVNVNFPYLAEGAKPKDTVWTEVGTEIVLDREYVPNGDTFSVQGTVCTAPGGDCHPEEKRNADYRELTAGNVTVTPITADRTFVGHETFRMELFVRTGH